MEPKYELISEVTKQYLATKKIADLDLNEVGYASRIGTECQKNAASQECMVLARQLKQLVDSDSAAIFTVGPKGNQRDVADLAEDEGAVVVNGMEVYTKIAELVMPSLGSGHTFTFETAQALMAAMTRIGNYVGAASFLMPLVHQYYGMTFDTIDGLTSFVKEVVQKSNGDDFNTFYIAQKVFEHILYCEYDSNVVVVVVIGADPADVKGDLAAKLFSGHTISVDVGNPPEKNDMVIALKKLKPFWTRAIAVQTAFNAAKARIAKAQKQAASENEPSVEETDTTGE